MAKSARTPAADPWESGKFGREEAYVKKADAADEQALDEALGLQMISIRLQRKLITNLKFIAMHHGIGYQPLVRDLLSRFVNSEMKLILKETLERMELEEKQKAVNGNYKLPPVKQKAKKAA